MCAPLLAQEASAPQAPADQAAPAVPWLSGSVDFGARWSSELRGNSDVYRSVVNLGEGIKLFNADLTLRDPSRRLFDKITARGDSWGGEPYNTLRVDATREGTYRFTTDYRNIAYFSAIPSYANPALGRGILDSQRTFDVRRRMIDTRLELFPSSRISPYIGFARNWGAGRGVTNFTADLNEYAVGNTLDDKTDTYHGGVRIEERQFQITLEQGGSIFRDSQRLFDGTTNLGNLTTTFLGQRLMLTGLDQSYQVSGDNIYSKALFTARPVSQLDLYAQVLYSRPRRDTVYRQTSTGKFFSFEDFLFFGAQQRFYSSEARMPHTSGSFAAEFRPARRVRVFESVMTDRFHVPAGVLADENFLRLSLTTPIIGGGTERDALAPLIYAYNRQEVNVMLDITSRLSLRGGHRFVWGNATVRAPQLSQTGEVERGEVNMHVGLAGFNFRLAQKLSLGADFEAASADRNYFRTSLQDYQKLSTRARYQLLPSVNLGANFSLLNNLNPSVQNRHEFRNRDYSVTVTWTPQGAKWVSLLGDYGYSTLRSDINYLIPQQLTLARSFYSEIGRTATAIVDVKFPELMKNNPRLSFGGSLFSSTGSRPTQYYQPVARLKFPVHPKAEWLFEWRWYNMGERLYLYEGFRTHHFITGLRLGL